ncbi:Cof-type HAD-IIB family hydrolase [Clostridium sp. B9]|uniref:Cof-type HAD-IIB family hydrolase n=1 Tax=Clostridium sp. B9 TaxID=3423224 RepID=UPI003D2F2B72
MRYKMICIDMDGTLLNSKKVISEENRIALKEAYNKGVHIIICTGRNAKNAIYFSSFIGVNCAVIANNGAWIIDEDRDILIARDTLSSNQCEEIREVCKKYKGVPSFHSRDKVYWSSKLRKHISDYALNIKTPKEHRVANVYVKENLFKEALEKENIGKCIIIDFSTNRLSKIKNDLNALGNFEVTASGKYSLEVNNKGVSKGRAVRVLGERFGIKRDEIICIGDNENDLSMIKYAGLGVAMGNGSEELKKLADYVTDTNDNNGVAKVIYEFILKND